MSPALFAAVAVAGGIASLARYLVTLLFAGRPAFPWAVLVVNVVGSALGGVVLGLGAALDPELRLLLLTGVAGGLTTFSTLSVETVDLAMRGRWGVAALSIGANLALGIAAAAAGYLLAA